MMKRDGAAMRVLSREAMLELLRPLVGRVRSQVQRSQWRRHALRQHRRLLRETYTRPEKLLFICHREERERLAQHLAAACGPVRLAASRLVRAEVEEAELILCAGMEEFIELHRLLPHLAARATLLGLFATPRQLTLRHAEPAAGHLCEWLSTLPRARVAGPRPAAHSRRGIP